MTKLDDRLDEAVEMVDREVGRMPMRPVAAIERRHRRRRIATAATAVAAVALVFGGASLVSTRTFDTPPASESVPSSGDIYPMLDALGDANAAIYGTFATPDPSNPKQTTMVVGRRDGATVHDVVMITVSDPAIVPVWPEETIQSAVQLGSRSVTANELDSERWYQWEVQGLGLYLDDSSDAAALVEAIRVAAGADGDWPSLELSQLPEGLEVLDGPSRSSYEPAPGISTDPSDAFGLSIFVEPQLLLPRWPGGYEVVRVGAADGYLGEFSHPDLGGGVYLTWRIEAGLWAQLDARGFTPERLVEIAADVRFVDRATWEARYETSIDDYRMTPTTTAGVPESSS